MGIKYDGFNVSKYWISYGDFSISKLDAVLTGSILTACKGMN